MAVPESSGQLYAECAARYRCVSTYTRPSVQHWLAPGPLLWGIAWWDQVLINPGQATTAAVWLPGSARVISSQGGLSAKQCRLPPSASPEITGKLGKSGAV